MVFATFVVVAVSFLDRNNISIAASAIQREFALDNLHLGWVFSAFVGGYALAQPAAGWLADRFGPARVIAAGIVWWSALTCATAMVPAGMAWSLAMLMGVRFALGLGEAVIFPASNRLVVEWLPVGERGLANGVIFAGVGVGAGIAPPLITAILIGHDWHWAFYVSAAIGLFALALWLIVVRDRPAPVTALNAEVPVARVRWRDILTNRTLTLLAISYFTYGYTAYIFFTWFFKYLSGVRGLDLKSSGVYGTLPFLAMAVSSPAGGWLADRMSLRYGGRIGRCRSAAIALTIAAAFVASATQIGDARLAAVFLAGGAGALYLSQSAYWTVSANLGGRAAGSVSGLMNMSNQIGGTVTASLTPWLADRFGWTASFLFAATLCLAGAAAWLAIDPDDRLVPGT